MSEIKNTADSEVKKDQIFYFHGRPPLKPKKGGRVCIAAIVNENSLCFGKARCMFTDKYSKKLGREIALGRAYKRPQKIVTFEDRKQLTETFIENALKLC